MGRFLCRIGVHRWLHKRNPEGGMSLTDHGGGGGDGNFG